jgi:hypothetical protein
MCGIALLLNAPDAAATSRRMVSRLAHRGPDGQGYQQLDGCTFGHARLSIIDLATGDQPMADASGRYWITFNGEMYNYRELSRLENAKKNIAVQQRNVRRILGDGELAAQWPPLWTALNVPWLLERPSNARDALRFAAELRRQFTELYPQAKQDRNVALIYADVLWAIGRYLTRSSPLVAAPVLMRSAWLRFRAQRFARRERFTT